MYPMRLVRGVLRLLAFLSVRHQTLAVSCTHPLAGKVQLGLRVLELFRHGEVRETDFLLPQCLL